MLRYADNLRDTEVFILALFLLNIWKLWRLRCPLYQTTLADPFTFSGVGLHSGKIMTVRVLPAEENCGIQFCRSDVRHSPFVRTSPFNVTSTQLATTVACGDFPISTIEHLVSALYGLGVDNAYIEVGGPEIPILDGSSRPIARLIAVATIVPQKAKRKYLHIEKPLSAEMDNKSVSAAPPRQPELTIAFEIDYPHEAIRHQKKNLMLTPHSYYHALADARTFGFQKEVEMLWKMGLAKGGSMENAIVLDDKSGILNPEGLRHEDEFVSHKILDLIGDISLVGYRVLGHIHAVRSGHQLNNIFARKLIESVNSYRIIELETDSDGYGYLKSPGILTAKT